MAKTPDHLRPNRPMRSIDEKTWANLQARGALAGIALQRYCEESGHTVYVATRVDWAMTRSIDSFEALEAFLARAEAITVRSAA